MVHDWHPGPGVERAESYSYETRRVEYLSIPSRSILGRSMQSPGARGILERATIDHWWWRRRSGDHLQTLRRDRPYERMDITGLMGITEAQRASLLALGAVER